MPVSPVIAAAMGMASRSGAGSQRAAAMARISPPSRNTGQRRAIPPPDRRSAGTRQFVQKGLDVGEVHLLVEIGCPDSPREQEGEGSRIHLLVVEHMFDQPRAAGGDAGAGKVVRQAARVEVGGDPLGIDQGTQSLPRREGEGERHARRNALTVEQRIGEARLGLQRVAEGVTEVEQRAAAGGFALVVGDDPRLGPNRMGDGIGAGVRIAGQQRAAIGFAPGEEIGIVDQPVFHHLGIAGALFAQRERVEQIGVDQHERGLMEGADQILARAAVDRGLAADRAVDLSQQGGRDLHEVAAALQDRAGETDEIADHAPAQCDDMVAAFDAEIEQTVEQRFELVPALGAFAGGEGDRLARSARSSEHCGEPLCVLCDIGVGHDHEGTLAGKGFQLLCGAVQQSAFDPHLIAARAERDRHDPHRIRPHRFRPHRVSASRIAVTVVSWGADLLTTWNGASA
eukprot:Opistho-1_new@73549